MEWWQGILLLLSICIGLVIVGLGFAVIDRIFNSLYK
jgi:hypothetical protein